jgi:hypothetical protein
VKVRELCVLCYCILFILIAKRYSNAESCSTVPFIGKSEAIVPLKFRTQAVSPAHFKNEKGGHLSSAALLY